MSGNYSYELCKYCGVSLMEGQIHKCPKNYEAEIDSLTQQVEELKSSMRVWQGAAIDLKNQLVESDRLKNEYYLMGRKAIDKLQIFAVKED
jgi:hypothetical protein